MTIQQMLLATSSGGAVILANAGNVNGNAQQQEITISNFISAGETLIIPSGLYVWSDDTSTPALTVDISCTIINQGNIMGRGGNGGEGSGSNSVRAGYNGGSAIKINSGVSGVVITNESGGNIFGGGGGGYAGKYTTSSIPQAGGGGGGAGGGEGGSGINNSSSGGSGGDIGNAGDNGASPNGGNGGDHGGNGASSSGLYVSGTAGGGGGGGGRKIIGNQTFNSFPSGAYAGYGGAGGINNNAGSNPGGGGGSHLPAGAGGGGYGASGGIVPVHGDTTPSDGGKAIDDSGVTYTLTNNGTIYGGT